MPKSKNGYRVAVVNPQTLVGGELKSLLHERGVHFAGIRLLDSTGENEGTLTDMGDEAAVVNEISDLELEDLDVVFFCGRAAKNAQWIEKSAALGFLAMDLSRDREPSQSDTPLVANLNAGSAAQEAGAVVAPHPVTIPLALVLDRIRGLSPIELCTATVVQPASEFDKEGVDELFQQTIQSLNLQSLSTDVFARQIAFNLFPAPSADSAEAQVETELRSILGVTVAVSLVQGSTFHGHSFSIFVRTKEPLETEAIRAALGASPAIEAVDEESGSTVDAGTKDSVLVGRVKRDDAVPNGIWIWAVCDNLRRGSALNALLVAETMFNDFSWAN
ncbi:MAG: Asd/ArgC dimerization domain-containing protein [Thermoanaerobaculia bacterium]